MSQMSPYNGFSPEERMKAWKVQKDLLSKGKIRDWKAMPCEICGQHNPTSMPHLENYFVVTEFHPLCVQCHITLHSRFSYPTEWKKLLFDILNGWKPRIWTTTQEYFVVHKRRHHQDYKPVDVATLGKEWYYHISLDRAVADKIRDSFFNKQINIFEP